ncbi:orotidine 5'-phosphate decarboxylase domain protein [Anaplasma phagocytophilum str. NCH-1]|uniref:Orotidine 5'-phosphate decarboxylase domain protein n=1 Tax=Anaplasma phagocytophilum str. NCH-1 TaxID=1359161 RepID=A0A0F3MU90_ANAPH|nr:orotidine 5'-phosphate decarboxylase domain protein [Anaplasma phagocytophilum str. NCH-1]
MTRFVVESLAQIWEESVDVVSEVTTKNFFTLLINVLVYTMHQKNPIICALDTADLERATTLAKAISGKVAMAKVGLEFLQLTDFPVYRKLLI